MKRKLCSFIVFVSAAILTVPLYATDASKRADLFLKYKPPVMGKPGNRIGGATRGKDEQTVIAALAPDHVGLSATVCPSLCWYVSKPLNTKIEITINDEESTKPLLEKSVGIPNKAGIQCTKLSDHGVSLTANMEYQWFVSVSPDTEQRSKDIVTSGLITFKEPSAAQTAKFSSLKGAELSVAYADNGYWYDSMYTLSELVRGAPTDKSYLDLQYQLLAQGGLQSIAEKLNGK